MEEVDLRPVVPAMIVAVTGLVVLLVQAFSPRGKPTPAAPLSLTGLLAALAATWLLASGSGLGAKLADAATADEFSLFFHALILGIAALAVLLSPSYLRENGIDRGEYYALLLFAVVGMLGLVSSIELVSMFVALEIMSIALYGMTGLYRSRMESQEAALKYLVTGAFSSAFFLYGIALLYGVSGSTSLNQVALSMSTLTTESGSLAILGAGMLLVGLGFKVAVVPFHMWAPDVYQGAPTPATALMSAGVKAAAFAALLRIFGTGLVGLADQWQPLVASLAVVTMIVGNLSALAQHNLKRLLAFSSVAHAGYVLVALVARPGVAGEAVLFYLVTYGAVNLGAFGVIAALSRNGSEPLSLNDVAGLSERRPALAAALALFFVSLTGIPLTAGFVGKFYLFNAAVSSGWVGLAIVGLLMSVVSAYYYLRVVVAMYMHEPGDVDDWATVSASASVALVISAAVTLGLGLYPAPVLSLARLAARSLL